MKEVWICEECGAVYNGEIYGCLACDSEDSLIWEIVNDDDERLKDIYEIDE